MRLIAFLLLFFAFFGTKISAQIDLNNGLIAYYPFIGNANDVSGNGFHGVVRNGAFLTTDRFGNPNSAFYFDGIDDYIEINDNGGLSPAAVTVVALINTEVASPQTIVGKIEYSTGYAATYHLGINYDVQVGYFFGVTPYTASCFQQYPYDPGNPFARSTYNFSTNEWHCLVGTFQDSVLRIYIDGVLSDTKFTNYKDLMRCNNTQLLIGSWWSGDNVKFKGKIDEVRIYDRALNSQEVAALCNTPTTLCTGSLGDPVVNINFGSGNNPGPAIPAIVPGASSTHNYVAVNGNPATPTPIDGQYTVTNNVPLNSAWFSGMPDHTSGDVNGYMAFYNSQETAGLEFYRQTVGNLCGSNTYEFAAWIANCVNPFVLNGVDPDITFRIERTDGSLIASYNTGPIPESAVFTWKQYGFYFTMPVNETTVVLKMINNSVGGNALPGNDLAIDDITFRPCGPATNASFDANTQVDSATVCEGQQQSLYGSLSTGFTNPGYRWQVSSDNGQSWSDIPSSNNLQIIYTTSVTGQTRFIMLRMVTAEGNNINSPNCRVVSNSIVLKVVPDLLCNQPFIGTPISGIINSYTPVTVLDPCTNTLTVGDASAFNAGDTVILIQMKGAVIDSSNSASFGKISSYGNAGNYEYNYILQKNGNNLVLRNELLRTYDVPGGVVQLVRVPYYINATVVGELTAQAWNGTTGGILALTVRDLLFLSANMDVSGKGFLGGRANNSRALVTNCNQNDYNYPAGSILAAAKGESIATIGSQISHGKGAPANGGGGGLDHNSGGGGGGNGGAGGFGGYQLEACTGSSFDNRGIGGKNLAYSNAANKVFLGGGGGAGHSNQPDGIEMNGGNGGGIMIIRATVIHNDGNKILAKGNNGTLCNLPNMDNCHDGNGGGGGGGSVLIEAFDYPTSTTIDVSGGNGADLVIFNNSGGGRIGPGGGGGA